MKIAQLLTVIDEDEQIFITDDNAPIFEMPIFSGRAGDIENDNPINEMNIINITAADWELLILAERDDK